MSGIVNALLQQAMSGSLNGNPLMQTFNQMMAGKDTKAQIETLLNCAKSKGIDVNAKIFSESDLKTLKLK